MEGDQSVWPTHLSLVVSKRNRIRSCLSLLIPAFRLGQNRQISVSLCPHRKEIFVALTTSRCVARKRRCAGQSEMRERIQRRERRVTSVIENPLILRRRFRPSLELQVSSSAQVLWPEFGGGFISGRCLQLIYRLRRITALQLHRCADRG